MKNNNNIFIEDKEFSLFIRLLFFVRSYDRLISPITEVPISDVIMFDFQKLFLESLLPILA